MFKLLINRVPLLLVPRSTNVGRFSSSAFLQNPIGSGKGGKAEKDAAKALKAEKAALKPKVEKKEKKSAQDKIAKEKAAIKAKESKLKAKRELQEKTEKSNLKKQTTSIIKPPTRPQNTWQCYLQDFTKELKASLPAGEKLPTASIITSQAAPKYKNLSSSELETLTQRHLAQKESYPKIYSEWLASLSPAVIKEENLVRFRRRKLGLASTRNLKSGNALTRPLSAYFIFGKDVRSGLAVPGLYETLNKSDVLSQSTAIAKAWKELTEGERALYAEKAAEAKKEYELKKAALEQSESA